MDHEEDILSYLNEIELELIEIAKGENCPGSSKNVRPLNILRNEFSILFSYSAAYGLVNLCKLLLEFADIQITDKLGWMPLMHSVRNGHLNVSQCIIDAGGSIQSYNHHGADIMSVAIASGNIDLVKLLSEKIKSSYCTNLLGTMTYVATACAHGLTEITKFLLNMYPYDIDRAVEKSEMTPLMLAVAGGFNGTVKLLLMYEADIAPKNLLGQTAFDIALGINDKKMLLDLGISQPKTPLYFSSVSQFIFPPSKSPMFLKVPLFNRHGTNTDTNKRQYLTCYVKDDFDRVHPLTPNTYISPQKKKRLSSPELVKDLIESRTMSKHNFDHAKKRSRSLDCAHRELARNDISDNLVKTILQENNLADIWSLFENHDITLRAFLTITLEDLEELGVADASVRVLLLEIIEHYKKLFPF